MRDRILAAAVEAYRNGDPAAVGMRDIARAADVAVGTLYNYFRDKAALSDAVQAYGTEELQRRLRLERLNPGRTLGVRLESLLASAMWVAPLFRHATCLTEELTPVLAWSLQEAQRRGEVTPAVDPQATARVMAAVLAGTAMAAMSEASLQTRLQRQLIPILLEGLTGVQWDSAEDTGASPRND